MEITGVVVEAFAVESVLVAVTAVLVATSVIRVVVAGLVGTIIGAVLVEVIIGLAVVTGVVVAVVTVVVAVTVVVVASGTTTSREVKSLAFFTASAIQLKLIFVGAALLRRMEKPWTPFLVTRNLTSPPKMACASASFVEVDSSAMVAETIGVSM